MFSDRQPRSFLDAQVLSRLAGMPLFARRPMQGNVSGRHASPHRGASVEFAEYRKYVAGDDLRRLDWRAYGRSDRFYVKEFEADTNLRCCFVVDTSGSMGFGSHGHHEDRVCAADGRHARLPGQPARRRGRAGLRGTEHRPQPAAPAQRRASAAGARHARSDAAEGRDAACRPRCTNWPRRSASGHWSSLSRTCSSSRRFSIVASSTCGFAITTWPCSTCSIRWNSSSTFAGRCGFSTWKGGRRYLPSPTDIADRYHKALASISGAN